jgi:phosphopantothenate synthetase
VATTYSRYKKLIKDDVTIIENDLIIRALYYIAQQKTQGKKQYQQKLDNVISELRKDVKLKNNLLLVERTIKTVMV